MSSASTPSPRVEQTALIVITASIVFAGVVMLAMARSDLWLDEVWSWSDVQKLTSPFQVFTSIHLDNNHYLSALWIWFAGHTSNWIFYRLPSLVSGVGAVAIMARIGLRRSRWEGMIAAALGGSSYLLAEYSSEARGYALAIFFSLVCLDQWQAEREKHESPRWILFSAAAILGLLGHLTFLFPYAGILAMEARSLWLARPNWRSELRRIGWFQGPPLLALAILWRVDLRFMQIGGGPSDTKAATIAHLITLTFGVDPPWPGCWSVALVSLAALLLAAAMAALGRERLDDRLFFLIAIVIAPAIVLTVTRPATFYPRYLLTCVPPFLLLMASLGARIALLSRGPRLAGGLLALLFVAGNIRQTIRFFPDGHGSYWEAYRDIQRASKKPVVTVGGEYDFRDSKMLAFYGPLLPASPQLVYSTAHDWLSRPPDWLIFEAVEDPPKKFKRLRNGTIYELMKTYPYGSVVSGFTWRVYRRTSTE